MSRLLSCWSVALLAAACLTGSSSLQAQVSLPIFGDPLTPNAVEQALASRVTMEGTPDQPIGDFAALLRTKFNINVIIDHRALDDVGLGSDTPMGPFQFEGVELERILELVLRELDLTFMLRGPVLVITTPEEAENHLDTHVYPVHDLISWGPYKGNPNFADYDTLIENITSVVAPDTWDDVGGAGAIEACPYSQSLIISQTRQVHKEVRALLKTLRKAKGLQPEPQFVPQTTPQAAPTFLNGLPQGPGAYYQQGFGGGADCRQQMMRRTGGFF